MARKKITDILHDTWHSPLLWSGLSILSTVAACILYSSSETWWGIGCFLCALFCGERVVSGIYRMRRNVEYLISAAMNGDFSYKFPLRGVPEYQRNINVMLNSLVSHIEKLSEEARQRERFLNNVINRVEVGIIVANSDGHVMYVNNAALKMLSVPVLKDIRQLPAELPDIVMKRSNARLGNDDIEVLTLSDMRRDLQLAEVESLEKLIRVLTHEIMNSLTPVCSIAESLSAGISDERLTEESDREEISHQMEVICSSSRSLMSFVKNFRQFTILPEPQMRVFYVKPFLERIVSLVRGLPNVGEVDVRLTIFPPDAMAYTDSDLLGQVILNILKNAVEAGAGIVTIEAEIREDESLEIKLTNDGTPVPEHIASQIFTPCFTTKPTGSGIGLSLSRRIITRLDGTLTLTTKPHTRFTIIL